ncbi:MAG TPA: class I SAM-dependent methyltransferase [Pyrinomonadaceae bacterium]|nr:class I SAM-dependent methyltransferase [Pyrinomonadaceae bacterium]
MPNRYDQIAPHYEQGIQLFERWLIGRLRQEVFRLLPASGRILEVGAGTGLNFPCYSPSAHGVASEPSWEMLRIARRKTRPGAVALSQNSAEELPFASGSFEAAFATLVFCTVHSPERAFAEIRRVVRSGGKLVLLEHVRPTGLLGPIFDVLNLVTVPLFSDHLNRRPAELARAAGLEVISVRRSARGIINLIECRV